MAIFTSVHDLPAFRNAVVTIGTFDGVHLGHRAILAEVVNHAREVGGESILITFEPHPRQVLAPEQPVAIITPLPQKLELVTDTGIDHVVVVPFTPAFAGMSAADYIEQFLVQNFHPHSIVIGYDHRFGNDRTGDIALLQQYAPIHGFEVVEIPGQLIQEAAISSTRIRKAIVAGLLDAAAEMLGRYYSLTGRVVHGRKLGRTIGYPTANLEPVFEWQVVPAIGVYAVRVVHGGAQYGGMMSIGMNPTVSDTEVLKLEVNIFDFDADIYDEDVEVYFVARLRGEEKFEGLDALTAQLHADKIDSLRHLGK